MCSKAGPWSDSGRFCAEARGRYPVQVVEVSGEGCPDRSAPYRGRMARVSVRLVSGVRRDRAGQRNGGD